MATATLSIDINVTGGKYQPLAPYSTKWIPGGTTPDDRELNERSRAEVEAALAASGFRYSENHGSWYSRDSVAGIAVTDTTIGVEITRHTDSTMIALVNHQLDGTYDDLPLAEKHRLSGSPGSLEKWLSDFDYCGKPRPGDGCK